LELYLEIDRLDRDLQDLQPTLARELSQYAVHFLAFVLVIVLVLVLRGATHTPVFVATLVLDLDVVNQWLALVSLLQITFEMALLVQMIAMRINVMFLNSVGSRLIEQSRVTKET
jgi:uncharacterized protein involved in exopolysaccharide biosynthesis